MGNRIRFPRHIPEDVRHAFNGLEWIRIPLDFPSEREAKRSGLAWYVIYEDLRLRLTGAPLLIPETRPTPREIVAKEDGEQRLAGYLLRRSADRIRSRAVGDRADVDLHYER